MPKTLCADRAAKMLGVAAALLVMSTPSVVHAYDFAAGKTTLTSAQAYAQCRAAGDNPAFCGAVALIVDPPAAGLTSFDISIRYDPTLYAFDPTLSGPLGVVSMGGDAPPTSPGIGTVPLQLLPATGYGAGAPLPGSTLTYTNSGGVLTVDYQLASPVTATGDINIFRLNFSLIHPVPIDLAASTVSYAAAGPGRDFSTLSASCTTSDGLDQCGSTNPASGVTFNLVVVPEPAAWTLLIMGLGWVGAAARRRRNAAA